jgi:hypothetical protein
VSIIGGYSLRRPGDQAVNIVFSEDGYEFRHKGDLTRPAAVAGRADRCVPKIPFSFYFLGINVH